MTVGEVYFMQEFPNPNEEPTKLVKIGLVGKEGGSVERLKQHQTGNPRQLKLRHVVLTPAPGWLEGTLHSRLSAHRVRREWFTFESSELEDALRLAGSLATESFRYETIFRQAKELGSVVSVEPKMKASVEALELLNQLSLTKTRLDLCDELKKLYKMIFESLNEEEQRIVETEDLIVTEYAVMKEFDEKKFSEKYPEMLKAFLIFETEISGKFQPRYKKIDLAEVDELYSLAETFKEHCEQVRSGRTNFSDELTATFAEIERISAMYSWDQEIENASLRVLCGTSSGIEGVCTWNRTLKTLATLDTELLETKHEKEYKEFVEITTTQRRKISKRPRRKI